MNSEPPKESNREIIFAKKKKKANTRTFFPTFSKKESQSVDRAGEHSIWIYENFSINNLEEAAGGLDQLSQKMDKLTVGQQSSDYSKG